MRERIRKLAKRLAYYSNLLPMRHRLEHRRTLTVVMFHRVLDPADPRWREANPTDTVSVTFFADCLKFFRRHYNVISLQALARAVRFEDSLPSRALLVTFDDGWSDNLRYAAPLLRKAGLPAVIFLAAEPISSEDQAWWQERVFAACRTNALDARQLGELAASVGSSTGDVTGQSDEPAVLALVARLATTEPADREALLAELPHREAGVRMMLAPSDLVELRAAGIELGVHGFSHAPLTMLRDPAADMVRARDRLAAIAPGLCNLDALAYPHGRTNVAVNEAAERVGFQLIFTSVPTINRQKPGGFIGGRAISRIPIDEQLLGDGCGRLKLEEMATSLFLRPTK